MSSVHRSLATEPLATAMAAIARDVDEACEQLLQVAEDGTSRLCLAMRHAAIGGGKRLRPLLTRAAADLFGVPRRYSLRAGLAAECLHVQSLIHDDLPCMDDDDGVDTSGRSADRLLPVGCGITNVARVRLFQIGEALAQGIHDLRRVTDGICGLDSIGHRSIAADGQSRHLAWRLHQMIGLRIEPADSPLDLRMPFMANQHDGPPVPLMTLDLPMNFGN